LASPATGKGFLGLDLPVIQIRDKVRAQAMVVDRFGVCQRFSMLGCSSERNACAGMSNEP
jgi:homoserine O-acetyltransferase